MYSIRDEGQTRGCGPRMGGYHEPGRLADGARAARHTRDSASKSTTCRPRPPSALIARRRSRGDPEPKWGASTRSAVSLSRSTVTSNRATECWIAFVASSDTMSWTSGRRAAGRVVRHIRQRTDGPLPTLPRMHRFGGVNRRVASAACVCERVPGVAGCRAIAATSSAGK